MAITEESRHRLFQRLEELLGPEQAATLMEHLPPVGWADIATKRDVDALAVATKRDLDAFAVATKHDLDILENRILATMYEAMNQQTWRLLGGVSVITGVIAAVARLTI